ncbi:MAG: ATPase [Methanobacterium sp.]|uniref:ATPase n=1 Tax=Methanobacterium sp. TaxID=2164 RepID=UPI003D64DB27|nr:ATPase [Methanobacterium sp.]
MKRDLVRFLQKIGVDTRFVSIGPNKVFINNLKFSRFSRKKEEVFKKNFPEIEVIRSTIFQKICIRASRNLAHCISPKDKIFAIKGDDPNNFTLSMILEPYKRKYGIEILSGDDISETNDLDIDSIALPVTLDDEARNILNLILNGQKIKLLSAAEEYNGNKLIYPLINLPESWIYSWTDDNTEKEFKQEYNSSEELLNFLETIIPDVRENLYKSALFLDK